MARSAKKTPSKSRGAAKKASRPAAAKKRAPQKSKAPAKRQASKGQSRTQSSATENWFGAMSTLVGTTAGREIIADVLEAAASALRRQRENLGRAAEAGAEQVSEAADTAVSVATEMAAGTVGLAQTAATVLADVVSDAARSVLPVPPGDEDDDETRSGRGARKGG